MPLFFQTKHYLTLLFLLCAISVFGQGSYANSPVLLEGRVAYFYPTGSDFSDIYGGGVLSTAELSVETFRQIYTWFSIGYLRQDGQCMGGQVDTTVDLVPLSAGFKYFYKGQWVRPYLGIGLALNYVHTHDDSVYVMQSRSNWGVGGILKSGLLYRLSQRVFFDGFIDYTYVKAGFKNKCNRRITCHDASVSGFAFGFGLGYFF